MDDTLLVLLLTVIGFFAVILSLAVSKSTNNKIIGVCSAVAIGVGLFSYSYGYSYQVGFSFSIVIKTLLMVCRMFSGGNDFDAIKEAPLFRNDLMVTLFWVGHFMAFYMTASTAVKLIGERMLKTLRTRMLRTGEICLIYDATPDTVRLAGTRKRKRPIVLVSEHSDTITGALADSLGGVAFDGGRTACADEKFLKTIGVKGSRRRLDIYCLGDDPTRNVRYAEALLSALEAREVDPGVTSLFLLGVPEERASRMLAADGHYGYGELVAASRYDLIVRLICEKRPPWGFIRCDGSGRGLNDLRVFVVGFGQLGQAALRLMVMDGQMEGSSLHVEVFDRRMDEERGYFDVCYPLMLRHFDIVLHAASANSTLFYERLEQASPSLIVLCTGDQGRNMEIGQIIYRKFGERGNRPCIIQCTPDSVLVDEQEYHLTQLDVHRLDRAAMMLNHAYYDGDSPEADWRRCAPFARASCRAAAVFIPAHLYAAGVTREEALEGKWPPPPEVLENLARTEHRRWCAFHLALGYAPMDAAELQERCERYRRGEIVSIVNNVAGATNACLVPWEQLDELSRLVSEVTGKPVDYKAMDRNNVLAIPDVLRQAAQEGAAAKGK